jgi:ketosteroid isomerase-like protein
MSIEARLTLLEDERAIRETLYAYGHAIDYGWEVEFLECWTKDAVLLWTPTPERDVGFVERRLVGREAIAEAFRGHTHVPEMFHKHLLFQPQIRLEGDHATVHSGFARIDEGDSGPIFRSFGRYADVLLRCDDGRWRFRQRESFIENTVPAA